MGGGGGGGGGGRKEKPKARGGLRQSIECRSSRKLGDRITVAVANSDTYESKRGKRGWLVYDNQCLQCLFFDKWAGKYAQG